MATQTKLDLPDENLRIPELKNSSISFTSLSFESLYKIWRMTVLK